MFLPKEVTIDKFLQENNYKLVFEDNFDKDKLDEKYWLSGYGEQYKRRGGYYSDDLAFVKDDKLIIRTEYRKDGAYGPGWYTGWVQSVANGACVNHIETAKDFIGISERYGYFEARIKAPKAKGLWGAFWLMPDWQDGAVGMTEDDILGTGEDGVEVDIIESIYSSKLISNQITQVVHADGYGDNLKSDKAPTYFVPKMYEEFHTYGVAWTDKEYIFFIDGKETYRTKVTVNGQTLGVSKVKEFLLLTVEIAGDIIDNKVTPGKQIQNGKIVKHYAGNPDKNNKEKHYDFEVDYVKIYKQEK